MFVLEYILITFSRLVSTEYGRYRETWEIEANTNMYHSDYTHDSYLSMKPGFISFNWFLLCPLLYLSVCIYIYQYNHLTVFEIRGDPEIRHHYCSDVPLVRHPTIQHKKILFFIESGVNVVANIEIIILSSASNSETFAKMQHVLIPFKCSNLQPRLVWMVTDVKSNASGNGWMSRSLYVKEPLQQLWWILICLACYKTKCLNIYI